MRRSGSWVLLVSLVWVACAAGPAAADQREETRNSRRRARFVEQRHEIFNNLRPELSQLRERCRTGGLIEAADELAALTETLTAEDSEAALSEAVRPPLNPTLSPAERDWRERVGRIRSENARKLYSLARSALRAGFPTLAYRMNQDVLRLDPDHRNARSVLGQQLFRDPLLSDNPDYAGEWVSAFEARLRGGQPPHIDDDRFGWIPRKHISRYQAGERPWKGSWISSEKEAELRRDFRHAWEVRSEHFLVKTNVGLEEGVELSRRLEQFHAWLTQNFAAFFDTPAALQERFKEAHLRSRNQVRQEPMEVHYFASRDEYDRRIRGKVPANIVTNGLYWQPDRRCYFFRDVDDDRLTTLYHEATHQILDVPTTADRHTAARSLARLRRQPLEEWILGGQSGFWLIEGLACYFESVEVRDGVFTTGRPDFIRFVAAQQRLLHEDLHFYTPLQIFCSMGKDEFQHHPNVAQLYSQASGVVHFLMHYDDGRYRDDLVRLLSALYRPDPRDPLNQPNLADITGMPFGVLDQEYREHIENLAAQVQSLNMGQAAGGRLQR